MKIILFFLATLFFIPTNAHSAGLFESCNPSFCDSDLQCPGFQMFGQSLQKEQKCWPEKTYKPCGSSGDCKAIGDCVVGNTVDTVTSPVAFCIDKKYYPPGDKGVAIQDKCISTKNCGANEQCVRITRYDKETFGTSEFVQNNNCVPLSQLPASLVFKDTTGSCGQNQQCSTDETCVENTYLDIVAKAAYVPLSGLLSFKQPVCYKTKYLAGSCKNYGDTCQVSGTGTGYCMNTLDAGNVVLKCIDVTYLPGGPSAPSNYACSTDSQCKGSPGYNYCLINPVTNKGNCFSQKTIFSDMTKLPDPTCTLIGKQGCEATGKESICASYPDKATAVCINYAGGGAALSSGAGTASPDPSQLPDQNVAQQTYEAYAPKLQIDIPNLTFAENITAVDGPGGIKYFSVPYLASYINAVYKYALGLGVLIAVIMLMYAGFRWMSSFGNTKAIEEAKTMVGNSVFGLVLLFAAFTILYYINPELPKLSALQIFAPKQEAFKNPAEENQDGSGVTGSVSSIGTPPGVSTALCEENKALPLNPLATPFKNKDYFACKYTKKRNIKNISLVIIHEGGSNANATADIWIKRSMDLNYAIGAHYAINKDGTIVQYVPEDLIANHTPGGGNGNANNYSIGIDLAIPNCSQSAASCKPDSAGYKCMKYTDAQYEALKKLLKDISSRTKVTYDDDHIIQHCEVCDASHCDARGLDWSKLGLTQLKHRTADGTCIKRWTTKAGGCTQ